MTRSKDPKSTASRVVDRLGTTFAEEAGIRLRDAPSPLFQLLVLSVLLSTRISANVAVSAAREFASAGLRTPMAMLDASWQDRVDALGRAHYRRYDERTSTMLGEGADLVLQRWRGDLRRLHADAKGDVRRLRAGLEDVPGIGPVGSAIFCREVQGTWPDVAPFADGRALSGAERLGLPGDTEALADLVPRHEFPRLVAACVRVSLTPRLARDV